MGSETATPTTANLMQNALAQLNSFNQALTNVNQALTALALTNIVPSPSVATTLASINAVTL